ncbi:MAG: hypothetical protein AB1489_01600 [Acidobacteriota bacterium]
MKLLIGLAFILSLLAPVSQSNPKLEIGVKLNRKDVPQKITETILTHPGQIRPFIKRTIDGVEYIIAFDHRTHKVKYIYTNDKKFRTNNGLQIGSQISVAKNQLISYPGWETRAPVTPDGWYPVVGYDLPRSGAMLKNNFSNSDTVSLTVIGFSKGGN